MSKALRSWRRHKDGRDGNDADVRPLEEKFRDLEFRVSELEKRPVALTPVNDQQAIPAAIGELLKRIENLENRPVDITPTEPAELQDAITELGNDLADFSRAVLTHISVLQKRQDASEARFSELPTVLAQIQAERRRQA